MRRFKVRENCFCEHYLNEISRHWREGLREKKLYKDDEVEYIREFQNLYGTFYHVKKDNITYDIPPYKLNYE